MDVVDQLARGVFPANLSSGTAKPFSTVFVKEFERNGDGDIYLICSKTVAELSAGNSLLSPVLAHPTGSALHELAASGHVEVKPNPFVKLFVDEDVKSVTASGYDKTSSVIVSIAGQDTAKVYDGGTPAVYTGESITTDAVEGDKENIEGVYVAFYKLRTNLFLCAKIQDLEWIVEAGSGVSAGTWGVGTRNSGLSGGTAGTADETVTFYNGISEISKGDKVRVKLIRGALICVSNITSSSSGSGSVGTGSCCGTVYAHGSVSIDFGGSVGVIEFATNYRSDVGSPFNSVIFTHQGVDGTTGFNYWESDDLEVNCYEGTDVYVGRIYVEGVGPGEVYCEFTLKTGGGYGGAAACCEKTNGFKWTFRN